MRLLSAICSTGADQCFRGDTRDSINQASLLYFLARRPSRPPRPEGAAIAPAAAGIDFSGHSWNVS